MGMVYADEERELWSAPKDVLKLQRQVLLRRKKDAKDFASTKHKGLPEKKEQRKKWVSMIGMTRKKQFSMKADNK